MFKTIHTNYGLQRIAQAEATGTAIVLSQMAVGDGNGNPVQPSQSQNSLARQRYRAGVNRVFQDQTAPTRFTAELVVPATEGGFTIREVGLYDDAGMLFAVANVPDTYKPTATEGAFSDTVVRMVFEVSNASVITINIDPNVAVATHSWVLNNVNATTVIPGGLTNQVLTKKSNANGDVEWTDPGAAVEVVVFSREETQTLAAGQTLVDLAVLSTLGMAAYIEGTRLRDDEFTVINETQFNLSASHPAGSKVTTVQNEEVGFTDILVRGKNLADVPDKAVARANLGIPSAIANAQIQWSQLQSIPATASRWPSWTEVNSKPSTYPPSAHNQEWSTIDGKPDTATRWPAWAEVSGKPSTFTPSAHSHSEYVKKSGDAMTGDLSINGNLTITGVFNRNTASSAKLKNIEGPLEYGLAEVLRIQTVIGRYKPEFYEDQSRRTFVVAEQLAEVIPEAVKADAIAFAGEMVSAVDYEQLIPVLIRSIQELAEEVRALKVGR